MEEARKDRCRVAEVEGVTHRVFQQQSQDLSWEKKAHALCLPSFGEEMGSQGARSLLVTWSFSDFRLPAWTCQSGLRQSSLQKLLEQLPCCPQTRLSRPESLKYPRNVPR